MRNRLTIFFLFIIFLGTRAAGQKAEDVMAYIDAYKDIAMKEMVRTGVPAAIKLAQGIHETEAGKSDLVIKSNNHFGIKCKTTWTGDKVFHDDDARGECFRSYKRPEESYMDHSDFLRNSPRYAFLFNLDPTDYEGWAYGLKKAGYATNIRYSQVLINLIRTYNLEDYTLIAMGKMKESDRTLVLNSQTTPKLPPVEMSSEISPMEIAGPPPSYPSGQFAINNTKVIFVNANTAWLALAEQYNISLSRLWDFNDLEKDDDILQEGQLVYLQRKRKVGSAEFHIVRNGENLYDICQSEGIRYESLLELNHLNGNMQPAPGEKLYLQSTATAPPLLISEQKNTVPSPGTNQPGKHSPANDKKGKAQVNTGLLDNNNNTGNILPKPVYTTHLVTTKETLYSISKKYGVEMEKLQEWNGLDTMDLKIGQSLIIYKSN